MNAEQWVRVKEIFNRALERDAAARSAYVAEASAQQGDISED